MQAIALLGPNFKAIITGMESTSSGEFCIPKKGVHLLYGNPPQTVTITQRDRHPFIVAQGDMRAGMPTKLKGMKLTAYICRC